MLVTTLTYEHCRQRLVAVIISASQGLAHFATQYEQDLLAQFKQGRLTIDEMVYFLESKRLIGAENAPF